MEIPVLSIQPLVENAVKHGVAENPADGFVHLKVSRRNDGIVVEVANSGTFRAGSDRNEGVGMANVRRRLDLCYGSESELRVTSKDGETLVTFRVPLRRAV